MKDVIGRGSIRALSGGSYYRSPDRSQGQASIRSVICVNLRDLRTNLSCPQIAQRITDKPTKCPPTRGNRFPPDPTTALREEKQRTRPSVRGLEHRTGIGIAGHFLAWERVDLPAQGGCVAVQEGHLEWRLNGSGFHTSNSLYRLPSAVSLRYQIRRDQSTSAADPGLAMHSDGSR